MVPQDCAVALCLPSLSFGHLTGVSWLPLCLHTSQFYLIVIRTNIYTNLCMCILKIKQICTLSQDGHPWAHERQVMLD